MSCPPCKTWLRQKQRLPRILGLRTLSIRSIRRPQEWLVCRPGTEVAVVWVMRKTMNLCRVRPMSMTTSSAWRVACDACIRWRPARRKETICTWAAKTHHLLSQLRTRDIRDRATLHPRTLRMLSAGSLELCATASQYTTLEKAWAGPSPARPPRRPRLRALTAV